jgi:cytochrome c oxidase cbb3-type subunit 2
VTKPLPIFPLLIVAILAAGVVCYFLFNGNRSSASSDSSVIDPTQIAELEIKPQRPDGASSWAAIPVPEKPNLDEAMAVRGKEIFTKACAACHGPEAKGDGPAPKRLDFPSLPADLTQPDQWIKIRTTSMESVPSDEDLFRTITRGVPGTAMWSFRNLPENDRWALIAYLKTLSPAYAKPFETVTLSPKLPRSPELLAQGKEIYQNVCANCHGLEGTGPAVPVRDSRTGKVYPGVMWSRKGGTEMLTGSSEDDIARTLMTGLDSRSPMRSFKLYFYVSAKPSKSDQEEGDRKLWGTVYYVRDLLERTKK